MRSTSSVNMMENLHRLRVVGVGIFATKVLMSYVHALHGLVKKPTSRRTKTVLPFGQHLMRTLLTLAITKRENQILLQQKEGIIKGGE
jgi:hypothetical protein